MSSFSISYSFSSFGISARGTSAEMEIAWLVPIVFFYYLSLSSELMLHAHHSLFTTQVDNIPSVGWPAFLKTMFLMRFLSKIWHTSYLFRSFRWKCIHMTKSSFDHCATWGRGCKWFSVSTATGIGARESPFSNIITYCIFPFIYYLYIKVKGGLWPFPTSLELVPFV